MGRLHIDDNNFSMPSLQIVLYGCAASTATHRTAFVRQPNVASCHVRNEYENREYTWSTVSSANRRAFAFKNFWKCASSLSRRAYEVSQALACTPAWAALSCRSLSRSSCTLVEMARIGLVSIVRRRCKLRPRCATLGEARRDSAASHRRVPSCSPYHAGLGLLYSTS